MDTDKTFEEYFDDESNETTALAPVEVETVHVRPDLQPIPIDSVPNLDEMEAGFTLEQRYVRFEQEGQTERGILIGYNQMASMNGGTKDVAIFQNQDGIWANAGDNLVRQVKNVPIGTPLVITYLGKKPSKNSRNEFKAFDVRVLRPKTVGMQAPPPPPPVADMSHLKQGGVPIPSKQGKTINNVAFFDYAREHNLTPLAQEMGAKLAKEAKRTGLPVDWNAAMEELQEIALA